MPWLMSWIAAHLTTIAIVGTVAGTVASIESVAVNTTVLVREIKKEE